MSNLRYAAVVAVALCLAVQAGADDYTWDNTVMSGNWSEEANWLPAGGPPGAADKAILDGGGSGTQVRTVTVDTPVTIVDLETLGNIYHGWTLAGAGPLEITNSWVSATAKVIVGCQLKGAGALDVTIKGGTPSSWSYFKINSSNPDFSGGITLNAGGYAYLSLTAANAAGTGTVTVNAATLVAAHAQCLDLVAAPVMVNAGATFRTDVHLATPVDVTIADGGRFSSSGDASNPGVIRLSGGDATFAGAGSSHANDLTLSGTVTGAGRLVVDGTGALKLSGANDYAGGTWLRNGGLQILSAGSLGSGTVVVDGGAGNLGYQGLAIGDEAITHPNVTVNAGGAIQFSSPTSGTKTYGLSFTSNGGMIAGGGFLQAGVGTWTHGGRVLTGDIHLAGDLTVRVAGWSSDVVELQSTLSGDGMLIVDAEAGGNGVILNHSGTASPFTGGVKVVKGKLTVASAGSLGTGVATAAGGTITTSAHGVLGSSLVVSAENGTIDLNSVENDALLHILPGGGFKTSAGFTGALLYSGTADPSKTNVIVEAGCILDAGLPAPAIDDFAEGDGGFGAFMIGTMTGTYVVGSTSGTVYRGLAATSGSPVFAGSVTEADQGEEGVGMLATGPATFRYAGAALSAQPGNTIKFYGAGGHVIEDGNTLVGDLEHFGPGMLRVNGSKGIDGKTLTVRGGYLDLNAESALDGATVNVEAGGVFASDLPCEAGTIHVKAGGGVQLVGSNYVPLADLGGGAAWTFEVGSSVAFGGDKFMGTYELLDDLTPAQGKANFLLWNDYRGTGMSTALPASGLILSGRTRLTIAPRNSDGLIYSHAIESGGFITIEPGSSQGRIAAPDGLTLQVGCPVTFGTGTLIVGDAEPFNALCTQDHNGYQGGFVEISQGGRVQLTNSSNVFAALDIQAGEVHVTNVGHLGRAADIHVADGTMLWIESGSSTVNAVFSGAGTVRQADYNVRSLAIETADGVAAGISPGAGNTPAVLTFEAGVSLLSYDGTVRPTVAIDVVASGVGPVPGRDFDQIVTAIAAGMGGAYSGGIDIADADLVVSLPVPSSLLKPDQLDNMAILVNTNPQQDINGPFHDAAMGETIGVPGDNHWQIKAGEALVDYSDPDQVVLIGASIDWAALQGDANLDGLVGIADLTALADHYGDSAGTDWMDGDFNFDGIVGIADLVAMADHYGEKESGATVPEPFTAALLAIGGVALIRRRR